MKTLAERQKVEAAISPQDISTADVTSAWFSVTNFRRFLAVVTTATIAAGSNVTVELLQATDDAGTGSTTLAGPVEAVAAVGGEPLEVQVEAQVEEMNDGFTHAAVRVTSDNATAVDGAAHLILGDSRYEPVI